MVKVLIFSVFCIAFISAKGIFKRADSNGDGCTDEENAMLEKCAPLSKKHSLLLENKNILKDGAEAFEKLAEACKEEVKCMAPIKCKSVRSFIDEGTAPSCMLAACNAKLLAVKNDHDCLKNFMFNGEDEREFKKEKECPEIKKHEDCIKKVMTDTCGAEAYEFHNKVIKTLEC